MATNTTTRLLDQILEGPPPGREAHGDGGVEDGVHAGPGGEGELRVHGEHVEVAHERSGEHRQADGGKGKRQHLGKRKM